MLVEKILIFLLGVCDAYEHLSARSALINWQRWVFFVHSIEHYLCWKKEQKKENSHAVQQNYLSKLERVMVKWFLPTTSICVY